jgi:hypothetical protein
MENLQIDFDHALLAILDACEHSDNVTPAEFELVLGLLKKAKAESQQCKVGYIAKANGDLFHRFFESKDALLRHLDERQQVLYNNAIKYSELYNFFLSRNYFRVV